MRGQNTFTIKMDNGDNERITTAIQVCRELYGLLEEQYKNTGNVIEDDMTVLKNAVMLLELVQNRESFWEGDADHERNETDGTGETRQ